MDGIINQAVYCPEDYPKKKRTVSNQQYLYVDGRSCMTQKGKN